MTKQEVKQTLARVSVPYAFAPNDSAAIETLMKRRHWIAHRADPNAAGGPGHHTPQPIDRTLVDEWMTAVETVGNGVLAAL
jgi:hypothetical protein